MRTVYVHISVLEVGNVNSADGTVDVEICAHCKWFEQEARSVKDSAERWRPKVFIFNAKSGMHQKVMMDVCSPTGLCVYDVRFAGKVHARFDLRTFPFDACRLRVMFELLGQSSEEAQLRWCRKDADVHDIIRGSASNFGSVSNRGKWKSECWEAAVDFPEPKVTLERIMMSGWSIRHMQLTSSNVAFPGVGSFDQVQLKCDLRRNAYYYITKVFFLILVIAFNSLQVFQMPLAAYINRAALVTACMGAEAAMMWIFRESVPKMNYLTVADKFVQATFMYLASVGIACFWIDREHKRNPEHAAMLNSTARWVLPCIYIWLLTSITATPLIAHVRVFRCTRSLPMVKTKHYHSLAERGRSVSAE